MGARDVGILRGDADGAQAAVVLGGLLGGTGGLCHHEAAGAELQVGQLHHLGLRLEQRVLAADAAIGRAELHERRGVGGAHDDVLHARVADDELTAGVVQPRDVQAACRQARDGVGVERALRHGDAQRALAGARRGALVGGRGGGHSALEEEREAGGGTAFAVCPDGVVVAAAAAQRASQARRVGLEHDAGVVVEAAHDGEVDLDAVRQARGLQQVERLLQAVKARLAAQRGHQLAHLGDGGAPAADASELADGLGEHRRNALRALACGQLVERDEVRRVVRVEHGLTPLRCGAAACQQRAQHRHRCKRDLEIGHAGEFERFGQQAHHLGVGRRARLADELDAHLRGLARLGARLALGLAEHPLHVAEAERPGLARQARGAHAGDLQRDVGPHGQKIAARVEELERRARQPAACLQHVHHLERGRFHRKIALGRHVGLHRLGRLLAQHRLVGEHVAEARRRHEVHLIHPAFHRAVAGIGPFSVADEGAGASAGRFCSIIPKCCPIL